MRIGRGKLADLPAILAIDALTRTDPARRRWLCAAIRNRGVYLLMREGRTAAFGVMTRSFFQRWFVELLLVAETERRQGLGEALLARLEELALRDGEVWASTNRSNRAMRRLLRKRGFVLRGRVSGLDVGDAELFYVKKGLR